jgi:RNA polymerase sigma-70 factor, ECF subfamily
MNDMAYSEEELIQCSQRGDENAFSLLVEQYRRVIFGTVYLILRDNRSTEETVQETIIKMWKHLPSLRTSSSIKPWLIRIAVNEAKQLLRKRKFLTVPLEEASELMDANNTDELLVQDENHQVLRQALSLLSPEQKEVIILRYFTDLTVPEIARATSTREGTIKSRLSRALDRLHEIISSDDEFLDRGSYGQE